MKAPKHGGKLLWAVVLLIGAIALAGCSGAGLGDNGNGNGGAQASISGLILNAATNDPVNAEVTVKIAGKQLATDAGAYEFKDLPLGQQTITASAEGFKDYSTKVVLTEGNTVFDIELTPTGVEFQGQALIPESGTPLASASDFDSLWARIGQWIAPTAHAFAVETPLAGASVKAYNWMTGAEVGVPGTTAADGSFVLKDIPKGADILIIVQKDDIRLSLIVPEVDDEDTGVVNAVSTLASEAYGASFGVGGRASEDVLISLEAEVVAYLEDMKWDAIDLRVGKGWITDSFGALSGDLPSELRSKLAEIASLSDESVAHARSIIADLRTVVSNVGLGATPFIAEIGTTLDTTVMPFLQASAYRLAIVEAIVSSIAWGDLEPGETYDLALNLFEEDEDVEYDLGAFLVRVAPEVIVPEIKFVAGAIEIRHDQNLDTLFEGRITLAEVDENGMPVKVDVNLGLRDSHLNQLAQTPIDEPAVWITASLEAEVEGDEIKSITATGSFDSAVVVAEGELDVKNFAFVKLDDPLSGLPIVAERIRFDGGVEIPGVGMFYGFLDSEGGDPSDPKTLLPASVSALGMLASADESVVARGMLSLFLLNHGEYDPFAEDSEDNFPQVELHFEGFVKAGLHAEVSLELFAEQTSPDDLVGEVGYYHGPRQLVGDLQAKTGDAATILLNLKDADDYSIQLTVTALAKSKKDLELTVTGSIYSPDGDVVAEIGFDGKNAVVTYKDGTTQTLS